MIYNNFHEKVMHKAIEVARKNSNDGIGGPFGAAIVKDNEIICVVSNSVLRDHDPTAHAEVNAIREACKILGTHDLTGCVLYATGFPCPMCMSAIIWANIETIYYCNGVKAAEDIGFRDDHIYRYIENGCVDTSVMQMNALPMEEGQKLYDEYEANNKQMY